VTPGAAGGASTTTVATGGSASSGCSAGATFASAPGSAMATSPSRATTLAAYTAPGTVGPAARARCAAAVAAFARSAAAVAGCTAARATSGVSTTAVVHACHRTTAVAETQGQPSQDEREMEPHGHRWSNSWTNGGPATAAVVAAETLRNLTEGCGSLILVPWCRAAQHGPAQGAPQVSHVPNSIRSACDGVVVVESGMYVLVTATSMNTVGSACMSC
jgi:hypothetical protein